MKIENGIIIDGVVYEWKREQEKNVSFHKLGKVKDILICEDNDKKDVSLSCDTNGHEAVDLGLSVKWANCNVGAEEPNFRGDLFMWGEIDCRDINYTATILGKNVGEDISGKPQYDAARANWGGSWRLPTKEECIELKENCSWKRMTLNGKAGYKVTGPNGNNIFLPKDGYRDSYWSSTIGKDDYAYVLSFTDEKVEVFIMRRLHNLVIRPVIDK